jgi:hypothetical protein
LAQVLVERSSEWNGYVRSFAALSTNLRIAGGCDFDFEGAVEPAIWATCWLEAPDTWSTAKKAKDAMISVQQMNEQVTRNRWTITVTHRPEPQLG